jgi:hypothetical protein
VQKKRLSLLIIITSLLLPVLIMMLLACVTFVGPGLVQMHHRAPFALSSHIARSIMHIAQLHFNFFLSRFWREFALHGVLPDGQSDHFGYYRRLYIIYLSLAPATMPGYNAKVIIHDARCRFSVHQEKCISKMPNESRINGNADMTPMLFQR